MAKPARPNTHTTTARTWTIRTGTGRRYQFSGPVEQLAARVYAEANTERSGIVHVEPAVPFPEWAGIRQTIADQLDFDTNFVWAA